MPQPPPRLRLTSFVPRGGVFHVARAEYRPSQVCGLHTHDFPEVFWVERGAGLHVVNGRRVVLCPGHLVLMRPSDAHELRGQAPDGFVLVNVAFHRSVLGDLRRRYYWRQPWPWAGQALPAMVALDAGQTRSLSRAADELFGVEHDRLVFDSFMLGLLRQVSTPRTGRAGRRPLPNWLSTALDGMAQPPHLAGGPRELARLASRCPEHVNRVVRRCLGTTATDLINDLRMSWAGRQLRMTGRPIVQIALDCGFGNLGHFYDVFRRHFRTTPRRYRIEMTATVRYSVRA